MNKSVYFLFAASSVLSTYHTYSFSAPFSRSLSISLALSLSLTPSISLSPSLLSLCLFCCPPPLRPSSHSRSLCAYRDLEFRLEIFIARAQSERVYEHKSIVICPTYILRMSHNFYSRAVVCVVVKVSSAIVSRCCVYAPYRRLVQCKTSRIVNRA